MNAPLAPSRQARNGSVPSHRVHLPWCHPPTNLVPIIRNGHRDDSPQGKPTRTGAQFQPLAAEAQRTRGFAGRRAGLIESIRPTGRQSRRVFEHRDKTARGNTHGAAGCHGNPLRSSRSLGRSSRPPVIPCAILVRGKCSFARLFDSCRGSGADRRKPAWFLVAEAGNRTHAPRREPDLEGCRGSWTTRCARLRHEAVCASSSFTAGRLARLPPAASRTSTSRSAEKRLVSMTSEKRRSSSMSTW